MFRFFTFLFGIFMGFIAAIFILPIPGKTFFNRMARLPKNAQNLIDDTIDLSVAFVKLVTVLLEDANTKLTEATHAARDKADKIREGLERSQRISKQYQKDEVEDQEMANNSEVKAG